MTRRTIAAALITAHVSGCASMLAGGPSMLDVQIEAPNDQMTTTLVAKGSGQRTTVTGRRFKTALDRGNDYDVTVAGLGYRTEIRDVQRRIQGIYWMNILFPPGFLIDLLTSAIWEHTPTEVRLILRTAGPMTTQATIVPPTPPTRTDVPPIPPARPATPTRIGLNPAGKVRIAILDFQDIDTERSIGRAAAENLRNALIERQRFIVVERAQIQQALQEQVFIQSGMVDSRQAVTIGKLLGANIIVVGSVTKLGRTFTINARFIDVQTGEAKDARSQKTDSEDTLAAAVDTLAGLLE
jgi:TolB-like protein